MSTGPWTVEWTGDGSPTLFHAGVGEACHSRSGAWTEARQVYAAGARLRQRALAGEFEVCRLLDVGTGLGWNLAAALEALEGTGCELHAVTLESDVRALAGAVELARAASPEYSHWRVVTGALEALLGGPPGREVSLAGGGRLRLLLGDARQTLAALADETPPPAFDAVFLDAFSPGSDPPLWEAPFLERVARHMAPGSYLATYCAASRVRLRLALAGLQVGRGPSLGHKAEGTLASPDRPLPPLPARAAANLARALAQPHAQNRPRHRTDRERTE